MNIIPFICGIIFFNCHVSSSLPNPQPSSFMEVLADDIKLRQLSLIGSHDAGTYELFPLLSSAPDVIGTFIDSIGDIPVIGDIADFTIIKNWSQSQCHDITTQLNQGARYFDLRVTVDPEGEFRICHGLYGPLLQDILDQFSQFLNEHPSEIVLLDFQHLFDLEGSEMTLDQQNQLVLMIKQFLDEKIAPSTFGVDVTLGKMRAEKKQVIIFWKNEDLLSQFRESLWDRNRYLYSPWYNLSNWEKLEIALEEGVLKQPDHVFYVNQAILSPDTETILTNIFSSLLVLGSQNNKKVADWYEEKALEGKASNILMIDNIDSIYKRIFRISLNYNQNI